MAVNDIARVANGWHALRTPEGRTTLCQDGVAAGTGNADSIGVDRHAAGATRLKMWDALNTRWVLIQLDDNKHVVAIVYHRETLAEAEALLVSALPDLDLQWEPQLRCS